MTITRYYVCAKTLVTGSIPTNDCVGWLTPVPSWFEFDTDKSGCQNNFWFNTPNVAGEYVVEYQLSRLIGDSFVVVGSGKLIITVNIPCSITNNICCEKSSTIAWMTREGGWRTFGFEGVKSFRVELGSGEQYTNKSLERRWSERNSYYDGLIVSTKAIDKAQSDLIESLKTSVQAYLFNEDTQAFDIAIKVQQGSYEKYRSNSKIIDERLTFIIAKEKVIQRQ